jgi:hypothetical protein
MGSALRAVSRKNFLGIFAGVLIDGVPLIAFNIWLGSLIERQGRTKLTLRPGARFLLPNPGLAK